MSDVVSPADRRAFITERRRASVHRFDTLHSPGYDENWGAISPSHAARCLRPPTRARCPARMSVQAATTTTRPGTRHGWLTAAGFRVEDEHEADYYRHFLLERR